MRNRIWQVLAVAAMVCSSRAAIGAWFMPLPQLPGATEPGDVFGVSADGLFAVGTSHDGRSTTGATNQAVRWTTSGAIENLGSGDASYALGVSGNGGVVVGYRNVAADQLAFRWSQTTGSVNIGDLPGGQTSSRARDVSRDGSVVAGISFSSQGGQAFRWTTASGMVGLGDLPGGIFGSEAFGTSSDGSIIVGTSISSNGFEAFRWSAEIGMIGLGDLPGDGFFSEAYDVSDDGSVIVGKSAGTSPISFSAFRWTAADGMIQLPNIPGSGPTTIAQGVSGDGNVVVGAALDGSGQAVAFVWDPYHGSRSVPALLESQGIDFGGFMLGKASAASYDGLTVVGIGITSDRTNIQPWMARFDQGTFIPEPSPLVLVMVALFVVLALFWWNRACAVSKSRG